jgi:hypothetical protein
MDRALQKEHAVSFLTRITSENPGSPTITSVQLRVKDEIKTALAIPYQHTAYHQGNEEQRTVDSIL